jgi:hypothetical protein
MHHARLAFPPHTLNEDETRDHATPSLWRAIPLSVRREVVHALTRMLTASLLPPNKEETND